MERLLAFVPGRKEKVREKSVKEIERELVYEIDETVSVEELLTIPEGKIGVIKHLQQE